MGPCLPRHGQQRAEPAPTDLGIVVFESDGRARVDFRIRDLGIDVGSYVRCSTAVNVDAADTTLKPEEGETTTTIPIGSVWICKAITAGSGGGTAQLQQHNVEPGTQVNTCSVFDQARSS